MILQFRVCMYGNRPTLAFVLMLDIWEFKIGIQPHENHSNWQPSFETKPLKHVPCLKPIQWWLWKGPSFIGTRGQWFSHGQIIETPTQKMHLGPKTLLKVAFGRQKWVLNHPLGWQNPNRSVPMRVKSYSKVPFWEPKHTSVNTFVKCLFGSVIAWLTTLLAWQNITSLLGGKTHALGSQKCLPSRCKTTVLLGVKTQLSAPLGA